jgi:hypothetical protein
VFRTVTVQVPLGVDVVDASAWATNGEPPSPMDMTMSTAGEAAEADAGPRLMASRATHTETTANARAVALARAG